MALQIESIDENGRFRIVATGEVDLYTSPLLREAILKTAPKDAQAVIVDLSAVEYMDSSGVATLIEGYKNSLQQKTQFILEAPSPSVLKVLQLSRLDTVFTVVA